MKTLLSTVLIFLAATTSMQAEWPINDKCPVDGKAARPIYRLRTKDGPVAFCCIDCQTTFEKSPSKYPVTKKDK